MSIEKTFESLTYTNWYNNIVKTGTVASQPTTGSDPNVQLRILNKETSQNGTITYSNFLINPALNSFDFNMEVFWSPNNPSDSNTAGDYYQVKFGGAMSFTLLFNFWSEYSNHDLSGVGVYVINSSGRAVMKSTTSPGPKGPGEDQWYPVRILYNNNDVNTWTVLVNGTQVLTYTDPNVKIWQRVPFNNGVAVTAHSGGGLKMIFSVRKLSLIFKANVPTIFQTSVMPKKFYPSADDSTFSSNRAAYMRTYYPRITETETVPEVTKQKLIYGRHDASSRMERLKLQAIGKSSMRLKESDQLLFKAPNVNDVREALSRTRSQGYVAPPKTRT
jgi:hypothetical protein